MFQNFRLAMAWLHTWFGLVLGFVLMVVFFFGALSVFDREIDRWAIPATRFEPQPMPSFDKVLRPVFEGMQPTPQSLKALRDKVDGPLPERFDTARRWAAYDSKNAYSSPFARDSWKRTHRKFNYSRFLNYTRETFV